MAHCCSQCSFTANFESALTMHHQLHHEQSESSAYEDYPEQQLKPFMKETSYTLPRATTATDHSFGSSKANKGFRLAGRTSSATRLFDKLRARICRSKMALFAHPEENLTPGDSGQVLSGLSECTSKALKPDCTVSRMTAVTTLREPVRETYGCHLCSFVADRITVLDRHLLNDHKIGIESLLKLVMAKTTEGISDEDKELDRFLFNAPYYKPQDELIDDGEFIIETITPKIKILRHASTNTDLIWSDIPELKDNCRMLTRELAKLKEYPPDGTDKGALFDKMATLNDCMCKFVDSSNMLKKVLNKELDSKRSVRAHLTSEEHLFDLGLGDQESPRAWGKAHSEKLERKRHSDDKCRADKKKLTSDSLFF